MKYRLRLLKGNMAIRADHGVQKDGVDIVKLASLTPETTNSGDVVWPCLVNGEAGYLNSKAGDSWLHLTVPREGWTAIRHNGEDLCELIEVPDSGEFPQRFRLTNLEDNTFQDYTKEA